MVKFVNPTNVIAYTSLESGQVVADLGCGSGFYAIPAAKRVGNTGRVYAVDIQESKLAVTQSNARQNGLQNVMVVKADLEKPLTDIAEDSCDMVIAASILHEIGSREGLLKNAYKLLKTGGTLLTVDWKKESTPFGPSLEKRLGETELEQLLSQFGFKKQKSIPADSYHYALLFVK